MKRDADTSLWGQATKLVRGGTERSEYGETSEAIYMNSGFCYESAEEAELRFRGEAPGYVYARYGGPTQGMLEERLRMMEGAEACRVVASGMAAVFVSLMAGIRPGDRVVASRALFGSCHYIITQILPRFQVETVLVDGRDLGAWQKALGEKTAYVFLESPSNPTLELVDIAAVSAMAHEVGACVIVDNIFATPILQHPLVLGADVVVYSTTKHIDGQGRSLGGAILGSKPFIEEVVTPFHRHSGPAMSPFNAWLALKGLETLPLRVERHCANALAIARYLEMSPAIERVIYPGLPSHPQYELAQRQMSSGGTMVAFVVKGGKVGAFGVMDRLEIIDISNNLGDTKSLITHPATTTHRNVDAGARAEMGLSDGLLRLSVGIEDVADLIRDLDQALGAMLPSLGA